MSPDPAARNFFFTTSPVSASSVVSHTEPHQTPCAPRAIAAATWRPVPMPPAPSTGVGCSASTTCGTSTIVAMVPVWPPASPPCAMTRSTPIACDRFACSTVPARAATFTPRECARVDEVGARGAERAGDQAHRVAERDVEQLVALLRRHRQPAGARLDALGQRRHVVPREHVVEELPLLRRQQRSEVLARRPCPGGVAELGRQQQVDAVRPALGLLVDPGEVDLQRLRRVGGGTEHPHPARVAHGGDDVAAVAEGEDREVDPEVLAQLVHHVLL